MRVLRVLVAGAATVAILPSAAMASNVSVDPTTGVTVFRSGAGPSDVTTDTRDPANGPRPFPQALPFRDAAQPLKAGAGCLAGVPVWCRSLDQDVRLGGSDDRYFGWSPDQITVSGGEGEDAITANGGGTVASGGGGFDTIAVGSNGASLAHGNGGGDHLRSFEGVESSLFGGDDGDLLLGAVSINHLSGGGDDDDVIMQLGLGDASGGAGDDAVLVLDEIPQSAGPRTLSGGAGADAIVGGVHAADTVAGESGDDTIDVSGGEEPDAVNCGAGSDTVHADPADVVARNCETRSAGPMPSHPLVERALAHRAEAFGPVAP